jgi:hypothetical protein
MTHSIIILFIYLCEQENRGKEYERRKTIETGGEREREK